MSITITLELTQEEANVLQHAIWVSGVHHKERAVGKAVKAGLKGQTAEVNYQLKYLEEIMKTLKKVEDRIEASHPHFRKAIEYKEKESELSDLYEKAERGSNSEREYREQLLSMLKDNAGFVVNSMMRIPYEIEEHKKWLEEWEAEREKKQKEFQ